MTASFLASMAAWFGPVMTKAELLRLTDLGSRSALAAPSAMLGLMTSSRYLGVVRGCSAIPSQTSPATRQL